MPVKAAKITASTILRRFGTKVKYNHLLANIAILYNVNAMTEAFSQFKLEGYEITKEQMSSFSPYHIEHLGRLRSFDLD